MLDSGVDSSLGFGVGFALDSSLESSAECNVESKAESTSILEFKLDSAVCLVFCGFCCMWAVGLFWVFGWVVSVPNASSDEACFWVVWVEVLLGVWIWDCFVLALFWGFGASAEVVIMFLWGFEAEVALVVGCLVDCMFGSLASCLCLVVCLFGCLGFGADVFEI